MSWASIVKRNTEKSVEPVEPMELPQPTIDYDSDCYGYDDDWL